MVCKIELGCWNVWISSILQYLVWEEVLYIYIYMKSVLFWDLWWAVTTHPLLTWFPRLWSKCLHPALSVSVTFPLTCVSRRLGRCRVCLQAGDTGSTPQLGRPLEEEMAAHSRVPAWKIPWTEEPGCLQYKGSQRVRHDWATKHAQKPSPCKGRRALGPAWMRPTSACPWACLFVCLWSGGHVGGAAS